MHLVTGPVRYFYLRRARGQEGVENWPPEIKPLEGPENKVCPAVRLYAESTGWRAECGEGAASAEGAVEPALLLTRDTVLGLLHEGKRKAEVELLGVRIVNLNAKGIEYATHLIVHPLDGLGIGVSKTPRVVPIDAMVLGEYLERGERAEAELDLRLSPGEYAEQPPLVSDDLVLRNVTRAIDEAVENTARFYSYSNHARHGISAEVEAGRVSLHGRMDIRTAGDNVRAAVLAVPGVVDVADHMLYIEDLKPQVEVALAAKGLDSIRVLSEHALIILSGEAPDSATRYKAEDIAKRIPGVRGVANNIVVKATV